ncbi:MAG: hypothetical protein U1A27_02785 [Phycisphaerae bacterium]
MKPDIRRLIYAGASVALFGVAAAWVPSLNAQRVRANLVHTDVADAATPGLMLGPLLAIGRAPLVDYLWMRASSLKEQGRYFDALQLAETIGRLQPRFGAVWSFNAWNMSYNISVAMKTAEDRWRWVKNGIDLLRDQGLRHNPRDTRMYKELAWIYFHKVGDFMDDKHMYYKLQLALLMEDILGPGANPDFAGMAAAPQSLDALLTDAAVARLVERFKTAGADVSQPGVYLGLLTRLDRPAEQSAILADATVADARHRLEMFWRAKRLREEAKLDPARIVRLREVFGPLDFRTADANALYWSNMGVEIGKGTRVALDIDKLNTDRIELYCLQNLFRHGRLVMSPRARDGELPMLLPDVRYADIMRRAFIAASKNYERHAGEGPVTSTFESAFINFMREAIMRFNEAGQIGKSREYFDWLREHYPESSVKGLTYDQFVAKEWRIARDFVQHKEVQNRILSVLAEATQLIAYNDLEEAAARIAFARRLYADYHKYQSNRRYDLEPFPRMFEFVVHELGARMPAEQYRRVLKYTGFSPAATTQPAAATSAPAA